MTRAALVRLLLGRFTFRHWRDTPGQSSLLVLIVALGIAVTFSIRLANRAATASFQHFTDLVAAENDWIVRAPAGDLPGSVPAEVRSLLDGAPVHILPVVESTATQPAPAGAPPESIGTRPTYRLLGIDLVAIQNLARDPAPSGDHPDWFKAPSDGPALPSPTTPEDHFWSILRDPRAVFISPALAQRDGLRPGATFPVVINEQVVPLRVAGIIPPRTDHPAAPATLLVLDLPALQRLTGRTGALSRVEFRIEPGPEPDLRREQLREVLIRAGRQGSDPLAPPRWHVDSPSDRREAGAVMTRAFRLNLTILSLLALLVGLYLVVQALDGAVVRRRAEIGILRSLGVDAATIRLAWLAEAGSIGIVGGLLGALLGWAGAQVSVRGVGRTVNALYYATSADSAVLTSGEFLGALALAITASLLAGAWPARNAANTPPAQLMARHAGPASAAWTWRHPLPGLALIAVGIGCAQLPAWRFPGGVRFPAGGYVAALCWILGAGLLGGRALAAVARLLRPLGHGSATLRLALSQLQIPSGRQVLATAGLVCATAMTAGMLILVGSFDRTMRGWIQRTFQADLYVTSAGAQSASTDNRLSPATWQALTHHPEVADANVLHGLEVTLPGGTTLLAGGDLTFMQRHVPLAWVQPPRDADAFFARATADTGEESPTPALVSESFTDRFELGRGDRLTLPTPSGPRLLTIEGVFADYGNERGSVVIDRGRFMRWFRTEHAASVIVTLRDPSRAEDLRAAWLHEHPGLQIFTNTHLRTEILRIFRQTFAITYALEVIGLTVAVLGLAMTLASILMERRSDWTTLRALGLRHSELAWIAGLEGFLLAAVGLLLGLVTASGLGWLLIRVINKQTFGWSLELALPGAPLATLVVLVLAASTLISLAVGRWGARLPADREAE